MKIGVVTTSYPRWLGDHAGSFVEGHVAALRDLGHRVEVIAAGDPETPHEIDLREGERRQARRRMPEIIVTRNVITHNGRVIISDDSDGRAVRVPSRGLFYSGGAPEAFERSSWRAMLSATHFIPRFAATIAKRARNWDHIIAHWLVPSALAALPARKPITAIAHGGDVHTLRRFGLLKPTLRALRGAKLVFVSDELRRLAGVDGIVQPMGVDLAHFASIGRAPTTPPTVLFVGRLVPIKGVDTLIEAMAHLPREWRLVIAGDGPERRALEARARKTNATFLGAVSTGQRDRLLREASVVVVPSRTVAGRTEGCPTIAIEALAAGVPVVATVGRASEIVRSDEPSALARGIERAMGRTNTAALVRDLDWCEVANRLLRNE
jgi:glycosyltransferase involved in cell wall biosynthesis